MNSNEPDRNYITSHLFYNKSKLFFETENSIVKVTSKNWHKYLEDYGWSKLDWAWKRRLKNPNSNSNFRYGLLDCGANGNCLFHVVSEALNDLKNEKCIYDCDMLRRLVANEITDENFRLILESYMLELEEISFIGDWDPNIIQTKEELKAEIIKSGDVFWGDHILLQLLQKSLKFNVIILNGDNDTNSRTIHPTATSLDTYDKTIILYYLDGLHFQLVGYFNNHDMQTCFNRNEIPIELLNIYNIDCKN